MHSCLFVHDTTYQKESSTMVVLLQELVFAFDGLVGDVFGVVSELCSPLIFCHVMDSIHIELLPRQPETPLDKL